MFSLQVVPKDDNRLLFLYTVLNHLDIFMLGVENSNNLFDPLAKK